MIAALAWQQQVSCDGGWPFRPEALQRATFATAGTQIYTTQIFKTPLCDENQRRHTTLYFPLLLGLLASRAFNRE